MIGLDDPEESFAVGLVVEVAILPAGVVGPVGGELGLTAVRTICWGWGS